MNEYLFDATLNASIRVNAVNRKEAERLLRETIDAATANLGAWPDGEPIVCEVSIGDEVHLVSINDEAL